MVKIPMWTMRDGTKIKVTDMETSHIQNCINMLQRAVANIPDPYQYGEPEGDGAQDAFNAEVREIEHRRGSIHYNIGIFNKELKRRNNV